MRDGSKGAMVEEVSSIKQKTDGNRRNEKRKEKIEKGMTLRRIAKHERVAMLMHANENQLKGLRRCGSAKPVQRRVSQESLSHKATHNHTAGDKKEEMWKSHGEI